MSKIPFYIVTDIIEYIGGNDYLILRKKLTYLSQAMDLFYSDYNNNSFWLWNEWRKKNGFSNLSKPIIPERIKNIRNNPYVISIDPPLISIDTEKLIDLHKKTRDYIYN